MTDLNFNKKNFYTIAKQGLGIVVYSHGAGYCDNSEFALNSGTYANIVDRLGESEALENLYNNAKQVVRSEKLNWPKRKFSIREMKENEKEI